MYMYIQCTYKKYRITKKNTLLYFSPKKFGNACVPPTRAKQFSEKNFRSFIKFAKFAKYFVAKVFSYTATNTQVGNYRTGSVYVCLA